MKANDALAVRAASWDPLNCFGIESPGLADLVERPLKDRLQSRRVTTPAKGPQYRPAYQTLTLVDPHAHAPSTLAPRQSCAFRLFSAGLSDLIWAFTKDSVSSVQVAGAERLLNANKLLPRSMVILASHTDDPLDGKLVASLYKAMPHANDGRRGQPVALKIVMQQPKGAVQKFVTTLGAAYLVHVATAGDKRGNIEAVRRMVAALVAGSCIGLFPEGRIRGDGSLRLTKSRGMASLAAAAEHVVFVPLAIAYQRRGHDKPKALLSFGHPFEINRALAQQVVGEKPASGGAASTGKQASEDLMRDVEQAMVRTNTLNPSGIVGARLHLDRTQSTPTAFTAEAIENLLAHVVTGVQQGQDATAAVPLNDVALQEELTDAAKRRVFAQTIHQALRDSGVLDSSDALVSDKFLATSDLQAGSLPWDQLSGATHKNDPEGYWGNRILQQAHFITELMTLLEGGTPA